MFMPYAKEDNEANIEKINIAPHLFCFIEKRKIF